MSDGSARTGSPEIEARVGALLAEERLREAGELCAAHGLHARAAFYLERAACFGQAAEQARLAGDGGSAMRLAAAAADPALLEQIAEALPENDADAIAGELLARQKPLAAAFAFLRAGRPVAAGEAFEAAEKLLPAARAFRAGGDAVRAARVLAALRKGEPENAAAALLLGEILAAAGRDQQAVRALQAVSPGTPEHGAAQGLLATLFTRLGLPGARDSLGDVVPAPAPQAPSGPADSPLLFGRYEQQRVVASSPNARVLEARDRLSGHLVAVKLFQPTASAAGLDALQRFEREARALTVLRHPHVLPLLAFFAEGPAAVFPWQAGGALSARLERGPLAPDHAAFVAAALLDAVAAAHGAGVLHRDIKPSNVLFDAALSPFLADFGAAHVGEADTTVTAGLIGSLAYMSPEQLAAEPASAASDLYAVGAVLYECLTGRAPRPADEIEAWPSEVYPGELSTAHDALLRRLLARDPSARFGTAREAREAVRSLSWTAHGPPRLSPRQEEPRAVGSRLRRTARGTCFDELLRREVVAVDGALLPLARAVAALGSPRFELVLRVDPLTASPWIERAEGPSLAEGAARPDDAEADALRDALWALHASGHALGTVDDAAIVRTTEGLVWRFPTTAPPTAPDEIDARAGEKDRFERARTRWATAPRHGLCSSGHEGEGADEMATKKHPLSPLHALREDAAEASARLLGEARRQEDAARDEERRARDRAAQITKEDAAVREKERTALEGGQLRAGDLLLGAQWELAAEDRRLAAEHASVEASLARRAREREAEDARVRTAAAQAEADAVQSLLDRARAAERAKAEAAAEEAAEETSLARKFRHDQGRRG